MNRTKWPPLWQTALVTALGVACSVAAAAWLGPDANWDLFNYHYYNGFMFAEDRLGWDIAPAQRQTFFNPLLDLPTFLIIDHLGIGAFTLSISAAQGLVAPLTWLIAHLVCGIKAGLTRTLTCGTITVLAVVSPIYLLELGTSYGDSTTGVLILVAVLCLLYSLRMTGHGALVWALAAGVLCGAAAGLKLTNATYAVGLVGAAIASSRWSASGFEQLTSLVRTGRLAIGVLVGFVLTYGYWGLQLWEMTGNPFFPQFNNVFGSENAPEVHFVDDSFKVPGFVGILLFPWLQTSVWGEVNYRGLFDFRIALVLTALIAAGISLGARRFSQGVRQISDESSRAGATLLIFFALSYFSWLIVFTINRYIGVLEILAPVAFMAALRLAWRHPQSEVLATGVFLAVIPASMAAAPELYLRPGDRLDWNNEFGINASSADLQLEPDAVVVMFGGDTPISHVATGFPRGVRLIRVTGNLYSPHPGYREFSEGDLAIGSEVFDTGFFRSACRIIRDPTVTIAGLTGEGEITPVDEQTLAWLGVAVSGECRRIASGYRGSDIRLCPLTRLEYGCFEGVPPGKR